MCCRWAVQSFPADRVRTVRRLYEHRGDVLPTGEKMYRIYVAALLAVMVGIPAISVLVSSLSQPAAAAALASPIGGRVAIVVCGCLLAAAAAVGTVRGPALMPPFFITILANSDLPRADTLRRAFWISATALTFVLTSGAGLVAAVLHGTGKITATSAAGLTLAGGCFGVLVSTVWLVGQRLGSRRGWVAPVVILGATAVAATAAGPEVFTTWALAPLVLAVALSVRLVPSLLNALSGPLLLDQAQRWKNAETAVSAADVSGALAIFRARPSLGRTWRAVVGEFVPVRFFVRDLIGVARTPVRALTGVAFLAVGAFATALALAPSPVPAWLPASSGTVLGYLAAGVFTDGLRHAADAAVAPPLYGYTVTQLYGLHGLFPLVATVIGTVIGVSGAVVVGAPASSLAPAVLLGVLLVALRASDSAKGPLPPHLLTPVVSPVGDLSGMLVVAWQVDTLLIAAGAGAAVIMAAGSAVTMTLTAVIAILGVLAMTAWRLRAPEN